MASILFPSIIVSSLEVIQNSKLWSLKYQTLHVRCHIDSIKHLSCLFLMVYSTSLTFVQYTGLEKHMYVLDFFDDDVVMDGGHQQEGKTGTMPYRYIFPKQFHVSPFMNMKHEYDWQLSVPKDTLTVRAQSWQRLEDGPVPPKHTASNGSRNKDDICAPNAKLTFDVHLNLTRHDLNVWNLLIFLFYFPLMTWTVQLWIH